MIHIIIKLLSLLIFSRTDSDNGGSELLGYKEGKVGNESFVYYYIHHSGNIMLSLNSKTGDADMYVSEKNIFPTYYPDSYDLHSATCGIDIIELPIKSPVAVGIYGHSGHEENNYILKVLKKSETDRAFAIIEDELPEDIKEPATQNDDVKAKNWKPKVKKKAQQLSQKVGGFNSFFEVLGLIFL